MAKKKENPVYQEIKRLLDKMDHVNYKIIRKEILDLLKEDK